MQHTFGNVKPGCLFTLMSRHINKIMFMYAQQALYCTVPKEWKQSCHIFHVNLLTNSAKLAFPRWTRDFFFMQVTTKQITKPF